MSELTDAMRETLAELRHFDGELPMHVSIEVDELLRLISEAERSGSEAAIESLAATLADFRMLDRESQRYRLAWKSARRRAFAGFAGWHTAIDSFYRVDNESRRYRDAWRSARRRSKQYRQMAHGALFGPDK